METGYGQPKMERKSYCYRIGNPYLTTERPIYITGSSRPGGALAGHLYRFHHCYDTSGGFGDSFGTCCRIGEYVLDLKQTLIECLQQQVETIG